MIERRCPGNNLSRPVPRSPRYTPRMSRAVPFLTILAFAWIATPVSPCTIFIVERDGVVFAGANEDNAVAKRFSEHWVRFFPAEKPDELGYVSFGYDTAPLVDQAAVNEAGLFYDFNALPAHDGVNEAAERIANLFTFKVMLRTCRTLDEALEFMSRYDFPGMTRAQMVLGDATGASAIVERHTVTRRDPGADFQIGTNFRTSTTPRNKITCWRYKLCNKRLSEGDAVSVESVRSLLEGSMPKGDRYISWYSKVIDLKAGRIHLFRKADFTRAVVIDLAKELELGEREIDMDELMETKSKPYAPSGGEVSEGKR